MSNVLVFTARTCFILAFAIAFTRGADYASLTYKGALRCRKSASGWVSNDDPLYNQRVITPVLAWNEKIMTQIESVQFDEVQSNEGQKCYRIRAPIIVHSSVQEPFQARVWVRLGNSRGEPVGCSRKREDSVQCKKGFGSCIYCSICNELQHRVIQVEGFSNVSCPLISGVHTLSYVFCLPSPEELRQIFTPDLQRLFQISKDNRQDMFVRFELYDTDIYRRCGHYLRPQDCPYNSHAARDMIGCLIVYANLKANFDWNG